MMTVLLLTEAYDNNLLTETNDNESDNYVSEQKCKGVTLYEWQWVPYVSEQKISKGYLHLNSMCVEAEIAKGVSIYEGQGQHET